MISLAVIMAQQAVHPVNRERLSVSGLPNIAFDPSSLGLYFLTSLMP